MSVAEPQELEEVKGLVNRGQQLGVLTYADIATAVSELDLDEADVEELHGFLERAEIELVEEVDPALAATEVVGGSVLEEGRDVHGGGGRRREQAGLRIGVRACRRGDHRADRDLYPPRISSARPSSQLLSRSRVYLSTQQLASIVSYVLFLTAFASHKTSIDDDS